MLSLGHVCSTATCTGIGRFCYATIYAVHERVCTTAAWPGPGRVCYTVQLFCTARAVVSVIHQTVLFYSRLCCHWTSLLDSSLHVLYFQNAEHALQIISRNLKVSYTFFVACSLLSIRLKNYTFANFSTIQIQKFLIWQREIILLTYGLKSNQQQLQLWPRKPSKSGTE